MEELEKKLNYAFQNHALLAEALCHSSYANEHRAEHLSSNERLEFLGDSVLGFVTAEFLFAQHPDLPEGDLTRIRAALVCEQSLYEVARKLNLGAYLRLGRGEESGGGRTRTSILADATEDDSVERVVRSIVDFDDFAGFCESRDSESSAAGDSRIHYIHLNQNAGIAENTNRALSYAVGDYVGLLDHDDVLAENALYEMASAIEAGREQGCVPGLLYSDEDKCNGDRTEYYEPNFKEAFNLDLLLSNNYICHFLVMDRELIQKLKFRREFDGAQDYDLVLRAAAELGALQAGRAAKTGSVIHIPKVLYHWRCHTGSTAENPQSKRYAYDAGRRAVQDFAERAGWHAEAAETAHVGFYRLQYEGDLFDSRPDVGAVGGSVTGRHFSPGNRLAENVSGSRNGTVKILPETGDETVEAQPGPGGRPTEKVSGAGNEAAGMRPGKGSGQRCVRRVTGGRMAEDGIVFYENLPVNYSGYLHRAILPQDAFAVDIRNIRVRPECRELFRKVTGVPYQALPGTDIFDVSVLPEDCDIRKVSLEFGRAMREAGYRIIYTAHRIDL